MPAGFEQSLLFAFIFDPVVYRDALPLETIDERENNDGLIERFGT